MAILEDDMNSVLNAFHDSLYDLEEKKSQLYKDIIAIIGIFSGIVLSFSGAFSFSSAVLENIAVANFYKLIITSSLICIFLLSLFVGLYFFVYNITYNRPLNDNKLVVLKDGKKAKDEEKAERIKKKDIRRHRWSFLVPLVIAYLGLTFIITFFSFRYSAELSKDDTEEQNNPAIVQTADESKDKSETEETKVSDAMTGESTPNTD